VAVTDDGRAVSASFDRTLRVWDLETGQELHTLRGHEGSVEAVAVTADGHAVSASYDRTLRVWDLDTGAEIARFSGERAMTCVAFDAARRLVVAGDGTGAVHILELVDGLREG